jgi:flagellar basal-body rod protein FlgC
MPLFSIFDVSGSGMSAQSIRLNTTASNLANAENISSKPEDAYRARQPVFTTMMDKYSNNVAGVRVTRIVESNVAPRKEYAPNNPLADDQGYVYMPNINSVEEMANMISASRSYQNNVEVMNTAKQMLLTTLRLGQ